VVLALTRDIEPPVQTAISVTQHHAEDIHRHLVRTRHTIVPPLRPVMSRRNDDKTQDESSPLLPRPAFNFSINTSPTPNNDPTTTSPAPIGDDDNPAVVGPSSPVTEPLPAAPPATPLPPPAPSPSKTPPPVPEAVVKADMEMAWSEPAGLRVRRENDENLVIFRRAVGINSELGHCTDVRSLEEGRREATGMYSATLKAQRQKRLLYTLIQVMVYASHFMQIIVGASLTAL